MGFLHAAIRGTVERGFRYKGRREFARFFRLWM